MIVYVNSATRSQHMRTREEGGGGQNVPAVITR